MGAFAFKLPDVGEGIAQAEIVAWHVKPGDSIEEDGALVDVMTDKATVELTSPVSGRIASISGEIGDKAAIGSVIAVIETDAAAKDQAPARPDTAPAKTASPAAEPAVAPGPSTRPLASPAVRRRAHELGIDLASLGGSGPGGRITHQDLETPSPGPQIGKSGAFLRAETIKLIGMRRKIAERMALSKKHIPHITYIEEIDVTALEDLRGALNDRYAAKHGKLTPLPFWIRALSQVLPRFPQMNATFDDEAQLLHRHATLDVGIATQTQNGLIVPVLRSAHALGLWELAGAIKRLSDAARSGKAKAEDLSGSTITITSLGNLGGLATTPIINYPEVAILGPNRIIERPIVQNGQIVIRKMMNLSGSFDHRIIDGAEAAEFVTAIKALIETPALMFVETP